MDRTTDGAPSASVDPGSSSDRWESVLTDAIASSGIDPNATLDTLDDPADSAPQPADTGSSAGAGNGSPATPQRSATGDDGTASPAPSADPAAGADPDPLAGAEPFTYTVNGEAKTIDGAYRLPGEGLYVPEDKVPQFQLMASRAESLERTNRELYERQQTYERLTEWKQTGADGKDVTLTGRDAIEASKVAMGNTLAELQLLRSVVNDPQKLASLLMFDEQTGFSHNADMLERLTLNLKLTQRDVTDAIRQRVQSMAAPAAPAPAPAEAPFDAVRSAPQVVEHAIKQAHDADALGKLTADDRQWAARLVPKYVRSASVEEVRQNPALRVGEPILEPEFVDLLRERAALRASTTQAAAAATTAGKFNTGMNQGRTPPKAPTRSPAPPAPPAAKVGKQAAWDTVLHTALAEIAPD